MRQDVVETGVPFHDGAERRLPSVFQIIAAAILVGVLGYGVVSDLRTALEVLVIAAATGFLILSVFRTILVVASAKLCPVASAPEVWPRYAILCALHDEAEVVAQLIGNLVKLDYPADRLQGFLVLEAHDRATLQAAMACRRPEWLEILIAPPGSPMTKPRALNVALALTQADVLTVYDAEDAPDPGQLKEAAARFAAADGHRLACLQAPLRIRRRAWRRGDSPFLDRQFAAEYAALFETQIPGLARLGLPFPLGGTSNHFRVDALRAVGGWDAHNVTEDADLGFRLWRGGWRLGVLRRPTWETPPGDLAAWLPQRTRWLKGYMQTVGVHTRQPWRLGARGLASLLLTVVAGLAAAALHGPSLALAIAGLMLSLAAGIALEVPWLALVVFGSGVASAWLACLIGSQRAGTPYRFWDMLAAPAYWSMLSLAFGHAAWRVVREPFVWDKTPHRADEPGWPLDAAMPDRLSAGHAVAPESVA